MEKDAMTINLPVELESTIRSLVLGGRFASEDELVAEAVRWFLQHADLKQQVALGPVIRPDSFIGSMRDAADELDEIVASAMRDRREQPWRLSPVE
jgi:Arc/MetJ-type ribon-helix-helix transcriptional regulator